MRNVYWVVLRTVHDFQAVLRLNRKLRYADTSQYSLVVVVVADWEAHLVVTSPSFVTSYVNVHHSRLRSRWPALNYNWDWSGSDWPILQHVTEVSSARQHLSSAQLQQVRFVVAVLLSVDVCALYCCATYCSWSIAVNLKVQAPLSIITCTSAIDCTKKVQQLCKRKVTLGFTCRPYVSAWRSDVPPDQGTRVKVTQI